MNSETRAANTTMPMSVRRTMLRILLVVLAVVRISSRVVVARPKEPRPHRRRQQQQQHHEQKQVQQRRQKQHEELQRRLKRGITTDNSKKKQKPIHVLDDVPKEGLSSRFNNDLDFGQDAYNKHPTGDAARPLTPGDTQVVYVSFINEGEYVVDAVNVNDPNVVTELGPFSVYEYSTVEQALIIGRLQADYAGFPVEFVTFEPAQGPYATIEINTNTFLEVAVDDEMNIVAYTAVLFGEAIWIDFLNQIAEDSATVDANFWSLLILLGDEELFYMLADLDPATVPVEQALSQVMVTSTSNTAAHELGHLLGLRHFDSIGAPGDGIPNTDGDDSVPINFVPDYPGPFNAIETFNHLLASGASVGLTFEVTARVNRFFSERSAIKLALAFATDRPSATEQDFRDAPNAAFELSDIIIPNTIVFGENQGDAALVVQAGLITGSIDVVAEVDPYTFLLERNRYVTAEVVSTVDATTLDDVITRLQLYRQLNDGSYQLIRESYQEIESFDPVMLDVPIDIEGIYQFRVDAPRTVYVDESGEFAGTIPVDISTLEDGEAFLIGDYQLFIYSYEAPLEALAPTISPGQQQPTPPPVRPPTPSPIKQPTRPPVAPTPPKVMTRTRPPIPPPKPHPKHSPGGVTTTRGYSAPIKINPPVSKGKGGWDPFVGYASAKSMKKHSHKGKHHRHMSSKKMKSHKKKSSKKNKHSYPVYYKGTTPTYYKGNGGTSYGKTGRIFHRAKGKGMNQRHGNKGYHKGAGAGVYPQELPKSYFFYGGNGKGNRGIDVFVF